MNGLQHLVLTRLAELGSRSGIAMSGREAARRSRGLVSHETIYQITRGEHSGRITDEVAQGLSFALEVSLQEVYDAAGLQAPQGRWQWPAKFERLDQSERRLVEDVAAALLAARDKGRRAASD